MLAERYYMGKGEGKGGVGAAEECSGLWCCVSLKYI